MNDITTYLYTQSINSIAETALKENKTNSSSDISDADFSKLLDESITKLSEMNSLAEALDKSVLGSVSDITSLQSLSEDLLNTGSGREVIAKLAEGQLNAIVMTEDDDDDSNDDTGITQALNNYRNVLTNTSELSDIVTEVMQSVNIKAE